MAKTAEKPEFFPRFGIPTAAFTTNDTFCNFTGPGNVKIPVGNGTSLVCSGEIF